MLAMLDAGHDLSLGRAIARKLIGDHHARSKALLLEQLAQQPLGCFSIAAALDQDIEHDPVLIYGTPEPVLHPGDPDGDLVQVPLVPGAGQASSQAAATENKRSSPKAGPSN